VKLNTTNAWLKLVSVVLACVAANTVFATSNDEILERIKPVAQVCVEGDANCGSAGGASSGPKSGEDVFNTSCTACHSTGAAGAPKLGDKAAWADRIGQGMDTLHNHAIQGIRGMPPKGTCMSCSDDEIMAAVDYMVEHSK